MSNSNKHTPPPWEIVTNEYGLTNIMSYSTKVNILICNVNTESNPKGEANANAKLISAAPELLDALETVLECGYLEDAYQPTIDLVQNAINKARGDKINV